MKLLNRKPRLPIFKVINDFDNPEKKQLLPPHEHWHWSLPKINRPQDVEFRLSNYTDNISLLAQIKWIPDKDVEKTNLVSVATHLELWLPNAKLLTYDHIETYEPSEWSVRPGLINQIGSSGSHFKIITELAFRRFRIIFKGHMKVDGSDEVQFVKFSFIGNPTSDIYDFKTRIDQDYFKKHWQSRPKECKLKLDEAIDLLAFEDRIERLERFVGEIHLEQEAKQVVYLWGSHSLIFERKPDVIRKHLFCHLTNGQAFHITQSSSQGFSVVGGYTCFSPKATMQPIGNEIAEIIWDEISNSSSNPISLRIESQRIIMNLKCQKQATRGLVYEANFDQTMGWLMLWVDDFEHSKKLEQDMLNKLDEHKVKQAQGIISSKITPNKQLDESALVLVLGNDDQSLCSEVVGAKAASLSQLSRFSSNNETFQVPACIALTRFAHDLILNRNSEIKKASEDLEAFVAKRPDHESLKAQCDEMIAVYKTCQCPPEVMEQLKIKLAERFPDTDIENHAFAVRSSSWGEDGEEMSAAGQLTTRLNVRGIQSIEQAIMECFASKYSVENVEYKRQHGLSPNLPMAVVIQSMVQCHKAGVMFTCDPISGNDRRIVITANFGLGESVVSGQADPDHIDLQVSLDGQLSVLEARAGSKSVVISEQPEVHQWNRSQCCMGVDEMMQIGSCGLAVSRYFGAPRDIEWGFLDGQLYLFQSRPITGLDLFTETEMMHEDDKSTRAEDEWFTRVNVNEVMPYALSPLTSTLWTNSCFNKIASNMNRMLGKAELAPNIANDCSIDSYIMFFTLRRGLVIPCLREENLVDPSVLRQTELSFFGHELEAPPGLYKSVHQLPPPHMLRSGPAFYLMTIPYRLAPISMALRYDKTHSRLESKLIHIESNFDSYSMDQLYNLLVMEILPSAVQNMSNHLTTLLVGGQHNNDLYEFIKKYMDDPRVIASHVNRILAISDKLISGQIPRDVEHICQVIRSHDQEQAIQLSKMSIAEAKKFLLETCANNEIGSALKKFIKTHGHRAFHEWDMRTHPWRQNLDPIVEMIQKGSSLIVDGQDQSITQRPTLDQIIANFEFKIPLGQRLFLRYLLAPKAQVSVMARELTKNSCIQFCDLMRRCTDLLAKRMVSKLRLPDEELIHFLMLDELKPLIDSPQPTIVGQSIRRRQLFQRHFDKKEWRFDELISGYRLVPNHLKETKVLDHALLDASKLTGMPASSGRVRGPVRLVLDYQDLNRIQQNDILVTYCTDIAFSTVFPLLSGIITEVGGLISHGAVVAREYGLPSLLRVVDATRILDDGELIELDADLGHILRLDKVETVA